MNKILLFLSILLISHKSNSQVGNEILRNVAAGVAAGVVNAAVYNSFNEVVNTKSLYRYENYNGFSYDYSYKDLNQLVSKYYRINKLKDLTEDVYTGLDLNIAKNSFEADGQYYYTDTIFFPNNISFKDGNFIVSDILSNSYFRKFKTNDYGLYFINVRNSFLFLSDLVYSLKINVYRNYIVLTANQKLFLPIKSSFLYLDPKVIGPYNSHLLGYSIDTYTDYENFNDSRKKNVEVVKFNNKQAFTQLIYISTLLETRERIKKYFNDYVIEISNTKNK
jgi:hypothetical protein